MRIAAIAFALMVQAVSAAVLAQDRAAQQRYELVTVRGASGLQADFQHWRLDTYTGELSRCLANMGNVTFECFDYPGEYPKILDGASPRFVLRWNLSVQNTVATSIIRFDTVTGDLLLCEIDGVCWTYEEDS